MRPIALFLCMSIVCACSPQFHKQKYTNFGHGKAVGMKTARFVEAENAERFSKQEKNPTLDVMSEPETIADEVAIEALVIMDSVRIPVPAHASKVSADFSPVLRDDSLEIIEPAPVADSLQANLYIKQLKREGKRNLMLGAAEIAIGVLAFVLLPYALPILIVHVVVGILFALVASHKFSKSNSMEKEPGKYKVPDNRKETDEFSAYRLSHVGYVMLFLSIMFGLLLLSAVLMANSLVILILALAAFYIISAPIALIALLLLLIAGMKGLHAMRRQNMQGLPPDNRIKWYNAINWSILAVAFTTIVTSISYLFRQE